VQTYDAEDYGNLPAAGGLPASIECPTCHRVSYHPQDIENRYCGWCHAFHEEMTDADQSH